ncbi:MAG: ABC transporter permease [Armatimonadota bacterium]
MRTLWHAREILYHLVYRDLKLRYKNSLLGFFWSFLNPLMQVVFITVAVKYIMFSGLSASEHENYSLRVLVAFLPWMFFNQALQDAADSVQQNDELVKKVAFPRELLPLGELCSNGIHFLLSLVVLVGVFIALHVMPHWEMLPLVLACLAIQIVMLYGLILMVAPLSAFYQDIRFLLQAGLTLWFWILPIIHPPRSLERMPDLLQQLFLLNPLSPVILGYRSLLDGTPVMAGYFQALGFAAVFAIAIFLLGRKIFYHYEWRLPER